ncbi:MAG TPA: M23 family metallopeptidase [archaeon]|nr:M23 family metallopeptidase [archaeon]
MFNKKNIFILFSIKNIFILFSIIFCFSLVLFTQNIFAAETTTNGITPLRINEVTFYTKLIIHYSSATIPENIIELKYTSLDTGDKKYSILNPQNSSPTDIITIAIFFPENSNLNSETLNNLNNAVSSFFIPPFDNLIAIPYQYINTDLFRNPGVKAAINAISSESTHYAIANRFNKNINDSNLIIDRSLITNVIDGYLVIYLLHPLVKYSNFFYNVYYVPNLCGIDTSKKTISFCKSNNFFTDNYFATGGVYWMNEQNDKWYSFDNLDEFNEKFDQKDDVQPSQINQNLPSSPNIPTINNEKYNNLELILDGCPSKDVCYVSKDQSLFYKITGVDKNPNDSDVYIYSHEINNSLLTDLQNKLYNKPKTGFSETLPSSVVGVSHIIVKNSVSKEYSIKMDSPNPYLLAIAQYKDGAGNNNKADYFGKDYVLGGPEDLLKKDNYEFDYLILVPVSDNASKGKVMLYEINRNIVNKFCKKDSCLPPNFGQITIWNSDLQNIVDAMTGVIPYKLTFGLPFMVMIHNNVFVDTSNIRITSLFGELRDYGEHTGLDISVPIGTPILALADGTVTNVWTNTTDGNAVGITYGNGYYSGYAHLSKIFVKEKDVVTKGQNIGLSGDSGNATGPTLHITIKDTTGKLIDPLTVIPGLCSIPFSDKIKSSDLAQQAKDICSAYTINNT